MENGRNPVSKHRIQPECGEGAGWRGTGQPNPARETKCSGANEDRETSFFLFSWPRAGLATYPVDPYYAESADHTYTILVYVHILCSLWVVLSNLHEALVFIEKIVIAQPSLLFVRST